MKRILVISWFFPPVNSSEAVLTYKLLAKSRYTWDVFTQNRSEAWAYGREENLPHPENLRCLYAESGELRAWEDEAVAWALAHREDYALVMTRSMPPESHRAGLRIRACCPELRWIASFGDPIRFNPYELLSGALYDPYSLRNPLNRSPGLSARLSPARMLRSLVWQLRHPAAVRLARSLAEIERLTLARADRLIFNNDSQLRYMTAEEDAAGRAVVIPHSYDRSLFPPPEERTRRDRLRFVFTGQLNARRSALPLLRAVRRLKEVRPDLPERAEFRFFGEMPDADLAYILRQGLTGLVSVHPPVSYRQSLRELSAADWLLHIDADISAVTEENLFFAGKLADYFGAGRPILAVTMPRGAAADALRDAGALVLSFSVNEIKQALDRIVYGGLRLQMDETKLRRFSSSRAAQILDEQVVTPLLCQANTSEP